ncbi:MAG: hypothetical protein K6E49_02210 [Lachnospiraceae bacterium]|nr:hypothetical protein [Lachnospiraceae bacterium]
MVKKRVGLFVDIMMYALLITQMLYVFVGNNAHEIIGIAFFICLAVHIVLKKWWFKTILKKDKPLQRRIFDIITCLLMISIIVLMISSMGVSRFLFPWFFHLGSSDLHRYMGTAVLTLGVLHGGMHMIMRAKNKRPVYIGVTLACIASVSIGVFAVPYLNRHLKSVDISYSEKVIGDKVDWTGEKPLVVYFSRMGNTDFEPDVDAVSGASLLISDGEMMGNDQLIADMVGDILDCESIGITVKGYKYPSSYNETISVAGDELRAAARPPIEPIDVTGYDSVILIYPLWWNSIPMPVASFLEQNDFSGKTLYLIATQGSSGYGNTVSEIETLCPDANVIPGTSIYCEDIPDARNTLYDLIKSWNSGK